MHFLAPYLLWGSVAAGIPLVLHFFFRSRYRRLPWAAMQFLLESLEQTQRRLRFQEWLLLLLRMAVVVLLAVALARPLWSAGSGAGGAGEVVLLLDVSSSMGVREEGQTRWQRAQAAAGNLLETLPGGTSVHLFAGADRVCWTETAGPRERLQERLRQLTPTGLSSNLLPVLQAVEAFLRARPTPQRTVYFFTDLQRRGWEQEADALRALLRRWHEEEPPVTLYVVPCGRQATPRNAALVDVQPPMDILRPGERLRFTVLVRNTGAEPLQHLEVSLSNDDLPQEREVQVVPQLAPGQTVGVPLTTAFARPGWHVLTATLRAAEDQLEADNRLDQVLLVRPQVRLLVVEGGAPTRQPAQTASFYLLHALLPVRDPASWPLRVQRLPASEATAAHLQGQDLCLLVDVPLEGTPTSAAAASGEFLEALARFVRQGHGVLLFAGDQVQPAAYNRLLGEKWGLLPGRLTGLFQAPPDQPLHLSRRSAALPAFRRFADSQAYQGLDQVRIWRCLEVEPRSAPPGGGTNPPPEAEERVVLRYSAEASRPGGRPAVLTRRVGAGEVMLVTTAAAPGWQKGRSDPTWTDWPLAHGMFVPFVQLAVSHLLHQNQPSGTVVAGQTFIWPLPHTAREQLFTVQTPQGERFPLGRPQLVQGRPQLHLTELFYPGIWRLVPPPGAAGRQPPGKEVSAPGEPSAGEEEPPTPPLLAVNADRRESADLRSWSAAELQEWLGFPVSCLEVDAQGRLISPASRAEATPWLLGLVTLLAAVEMLAAWKTGQPR